MYKAGFSWGGPLRHGKGVGTGRGEELGHDLSLLQLLTNYLNEDISTENPRASSAIKHKRDAGICLTYTEKYRVL